MADFLRATAQQEEEQENRNGDTNQPEQDVTYLALLQAAFCGEASACFHDKAASRAARPLAFRILPQPHDPLVSGMIALLALSQVQRVRRIARTACNLPNAKRLRRQNALDDAQ
jgi:hypothetical protein